VEDVLTPLHAFCLVFHIFKRKAVHTHFRQLTPSLQSRSRLLLCDHRCWVRANHRIHRYHHHAPPQQPPPLRFSPFESFFFFFLLIFPFFRLQDPPPPHSPAGVLSRHRVHPPMARRRNRSDHPLLPRWFPPILPRHGALCPLSSLSLPVQLWLCQSWPHQFPFLPLLPQLEARLWSLSHPQGSFFASVFHFPLHSFFSNFVRIRGCYYFLNFFVCFILPVVWTK